MDLLLESMGRSPASVWNLTRVAETFASNEIQLSKRSIERFLEGVSWLETSNDGDEQFDGYGRSSVQMVFSSLVSDARRKRRKVFAPFCNWRPQVLGDDDAKFPQPASATRLSLTRWSRSKEVDAFAKRQPGYYQLGF